MNHLLHQISWHQYLIVAFVTALIYYSVIILRYFRPELERLRRRLSGDKPGEQLQALLYQPAEEEVKAASVRDRAEQPDHDELVTDTDLLAVKLKACISKAAEQPFAPAMLIPQLKQLFKEHQHIAEPERPVTNQLVVGECEKTGTALLTEEEVNQWWER